MIVDKNAVNIEITVKELMNKLILNFLKYSKPKKRIFFTERW